MFLIFTAAFTSRVLHPSFYVIQSRNLRVLSQVCFFLSLPTIVLCCVVLCYYKYRTKQHYDLCEKENPSFNYSHILVYEKDDKILLQYMKKYHLIQDKLLIILETNFWVNLNWQTMYLFLIMRISKARCYLQISRKTVL